VNAEQLQERIENLVGQSMDAESEEGEDSDQKQAEQEKKSRS
jgi:hypothetical protein